MASTNILETFFFGFCVKYFASLTPRRCALRGVSLTTPLLKTMAPYTKHHKVIKGKKINPGLKTPWNMKFWKNFKSVTIFVTVFVTIPRPFSQPVTIFVTFCHEAVKNIVYFYKGKLPYIHTFQTDFFLMVNISLPLIELWSSYLNQVNTCTQAIQK